MGPERGFWALRHVVVLFDSIVYTACAAGTVITMSGYVLWWDGRGSDGSDGGGDIEFGEGDGQGCRRRGLGMGMGKRKGISKSVSSEIQIFLSRLDPTIPRISMPRYW